MHAVWAILLNDDFLYAYEHRIIILCPDDRSQCFYPRIYIWPTIQKSEHINFFGADNFSDGLLTIEHSLPRFATLVPVHALDVLFQKARFQKLVLPFMNNGMRNLDVWTT